MPGSNTVFSANENVSAFTVHIEGLDPGPGDRSSLFVTSEWMGSEYDGAISQVPGLSSQTASLSANIITIQTEINSLNSEIANLVAGNSNVQFAYVNSSTTYTGQAFNFVSGNGTTVNVTSSYPLINVEIDFTGALPNTVPGGANTNIQFDDSGAFGGSSGFTFNTTTNNVTIANNLSAQTLSAQTETLSVSLSVGSNVTVTTSKGLFGNATVNSVVSTFFLQVSNSILSSNMTPGQLFLGNSSVNAVANSSEFLVGTTAINTNEVFLGNSTVNTVLLSASLTLANSTNSLALTPVNLTVGSSVVNTSEVFLGNSTVNAVFLSTQLSVANSTNAAVITPISLTLGTTVSNTTGFFQGNSTVNTELNFAALSFNGVAVPTTPATNANFWVGTNNSVIVTDATIFNAYGLVTLSPDAGGNLNPNNAAGINFVSVVTKDGTIKNILNPVVGREGHFFISSTNTSAQLSFDTHYSTNGTMLSSGAPSQLTILNTTILNGTYMLHYFNVNSTLTVIPWASGPF